MKHFLIKIKNKALNLLRFVLGKKLLGKKPTNAIFVKPNYYIIDNLDSKSVIIDVGTGNDADLSQNLITKYGLKSYGFDPTLKHQESLKHIEKESGRKFTIFDSALSDKTGTAEFNESTSDISGSFSTDHINMKRGTIKKYLVKTITLEDILSKLSLAKVNLIKIDIEGEGYKVINSLTKDLTNKVDQFVFEFHHHCIDKYSVLDTLKSIKKLELLGFKYYSNDGINYLFYR
jgi:FkbM family methyltransferase